MWYYVYVFWYYPKGQNNSFFSGIELQEMSDTTVHYYDVLRLTY